MAKVTIFSEKWFDMVEKVNKDTVLNLSPTIKDICLNIVVTDNQPQSTPNVVDNQDSVDLYMHEGLVYKGQHQDAETKIQLSIDTMKSLLSSLNADKVLYAFMNGEILVKGSMSQLMSLQIAQFNDKQKLLFNTILKNSIY